MTGMFDIGVCVGKFYPLHAGHQSLIRCVQANSKYPIVMVAWSSDEDIDPEVRANWIRRIYPEVEVIVVEALPPEEDTGKNWAEYTKEILGYTPDAVFTSEEYGRSWAKELGCNHVLVDLSRTRFPVSGTEIRANPKSYWHFLPEVVRDYYAARLSNPDGQSQLYIMKTEYEYGTMILRCDDQECNKCGRVIPNKARYRTLRMTAYNSGISDIIKTHEIHVAKRTVTYSDWEQDS